MWGSLPYSRRRKFETINAMQSSAKTNTSRRKESPPAEARSVHPETPAQCSKPYPLPLFVSPTSHLPTTTAGFCFFFSSSHLQHPPFRHIHIHIHIHIHTPIEAQIWSSLIFTTRALSGFLLWLRKRVGWICVCVRAKTVESQHFQLVSKYLLGALDSGLLSVR